MGRLCYHETWKDWQAGNNFNYEFNMGTPVRLPEMVDGYTYAQALNEGLKNDHLSPRYTQRELDAFRDRTYPDFYPDVDLWGEALLES